ncbi:protein still life, isoform SIF type 1 isoform X2 [Macrosteles quadrilineatus]|uniref:protein still life, isoform SIF type 1 isoform X2 n=1 Tax=Macrosteles quadrilineatus TaxID=74068 RepID=UPI0023E10FEC|nr:protein still life, isoform SIF type 1 isoform X2 [Macrosteles quadrilineatus]
MTNDTWGLNFTSPIDAKQFRECCSWWSGYLPELSKGEALGSRRKSHPPPLLQVLSPSFKFSRKASSSYSLKLEPPNKQNKVKTKRKPLSTPASPSRSREPQCTCMTADQYARLRAQDPRYRGSSTLPRAQSRVSDVADGRASTLGDKVTAATSSTSLYDNVTNKPLSSGNRQTRDRETSTPGGKLNNSNHATTQVPAQSQTEEGQETSKSEGTQAGGTVSGGKMTTGTCTPRLTKDAQANTQHKASGGPDYGDGTDMVREAELRAANNNNNINNITSNNRRTTNNNNNKLGKDDIRSGGGMSVDSNTLKRMLKPMPSLESPVTSPEMTRRRYNYYNHHGNIHYNHHSHGAANNNARHDSDTMGRHKGNRFSGYQRDRDPHAGAVSTPSSPTSRLLLEYEMHLRNTLAKGMDAESYSLHTFEALLTQSMENLVLAGGGTAFLVRLRDLIAWLKGKSNVLPGLEVPSPATKSKQPHEFAEQLPGVNNTRSPYPSRRRPVSSASMNKSSTLPLPHRLNMERPASSADRRDRDRDREGYYSDRNELLRERDRERGYLSDHNSSSRDRSRDGYYSDRNELLRERERERGYLSDHNNSSRCASCLGESARAQWFRHSDGWRSGSSTLGSGSVSTYPSSAGGSKRSPWDSLPSLRHENSLNDSGYKSNRADSFEQRGTFDRQDSLRSDYMSDRESRYGIVQQASIESTDSRLCYLTSSEMSDDDRMSLTTAVSDEEDAESVHNSPYRAKQTGTAAASFNCTGAVRKAGFLSVKKWLLRKKHQIELARKRGWKGYWVCLKGTTLLFYPCDSREGRSVEAAPKHLIIVDGAIMQPIPEHPKRDYIFCLSTAFGDAYLFQAPCQVELENWVNSIHSACAAAFARHRGKTGTLHLLQEEIYRLEKAIESDHKLKHMADLQQSVVSDPDTKQQINSQIVQWEENLERLHCEQFRLRCYMASLQNGELPNPKSLLTHVSRATKNTLNKLGVFTVSSFHAFICARSPSLLNNLLAGRGATKRRPPMLSRSNSGSSRRSLQMNSRDESEKTVKVSVPENQFVHVFLREAMSVEEFLASACSRKNLNPMEHFVRVKKRRDMDDHNYFVPHRTDLIETYIHTHEIVEVCAKILYQVELQRTTLEHMWGFSVEAELIENADRQDELCCYVSRVEDKSVAMHNGIIKGDEIMVINGAIVSDLDMMYLESVLQEELSLCMMMRSSRTEPPDLAPGILRSTDIEIESLVCPPPPSDPPVISEEMISGLIVPAPGWSKELYSPETENPPATSSDGTSTKQTSRANSFEIENLLKTAEQVTGFCRSPGETRKSSPTGSVVSTTSQALLTPSRQLTDAEKLRKVILELIDTERTYVKHLNSLLENYLEPLKKETFLSHAEIGALFGNIQEIVSFQRQFLQNLEEALEMEPDFHKFDHPSQFKNVLFSIGSAFLYYVNHFKLYSSFCASHSKAQKVLHPNEGNQALQEFLSSRNPRQQHSSTLESYLIKPIQRILKYPLLLQQLRNLTDPQSDQHLHLVEALKGMEKVAEHINEMQRIHEEYGAIFDHLFRQHQKSCKQPIDLSPGDLLYYGGVEWLNISDFLGKIKKGLELHAMCFVFKSAVVFLCKERLRQKKKLMSVASKGSSNEVEIIRYQVLIPVTEVQVRASSAKDMDSHFLWELIHLRSQLQRRSEKVYVLSNSTADFRNAFLKTIRQIIRESVRNMSIPATKPGSSPSQLINNTATLGRQSASNTGPRQATPGETPQTKTTPSGVVIMQGSHTLGKPKKPPKGPQRHSAGNIDYDNLETREQHPEPNTNFRSRSKTVSDAVDSEKKQHDCDPGTKSEGEDENSQSGAKGKGGLGRTPNHLTLSTTSTLSAGSTGSQARLIQSSQQPENYQPPTVKDLGSPVWKPRDIGEALTLPRKNKTPSTSSTDSHSRTLGRKPDKQ